MPAAFHALPLLLLLVLLCLQQAQSLLHLREPWVAFWQQLPDQMSADAHPPLLLLLLCLLLQAPPQLLVLQLLLVLLPVQQCQP
jgi:hypothetical protein